MLSIYYGWVCICTQIYVSVKLNFLSHLVEVVVVFMCKGSEPLFLFEHFNLNDAADSAKDVQSDGYDKGSDLLMGFVFELLADCS